jgi:hypothetical protein
MVSYTRFDFDWHEASLFITAYSTFELSFDSGLITRYRIIFNIQCRCMWECRGALLLGYPYRDWFVGCTSYLGDRRQGERCFFTCLSITIIVLIIRH